jgi:hypothetical protein
MSANPYPFDGIIGQLPNRTMVIPYTNRESITSATFELFEIQ